MKFLIYLLIFVGGTIGAYIPVWLWHAGSLSAWSIFLGAVGSFAGLWLAIKINNSFDL